MSDDEDLFSSAESNTEVNPDRRAAPLTADTSQCSQRRPGRLHNNGNRSNAREADRPNHMIVGNLVELANHRRTTNMEELPPSPLADDQVIIIVMENDHHGPQDANVVSMQDDAVENPITRLENPHYEPDAAAIEAAETTETTEPREPERRGEKRTHEAMMADTAELDGSTCPVCLDPWSNTGSHRLCSLSCGHFFGSSCIQRWLSLKRTCPQCNKPTNKRSVRNHYATKMVAADNYERDELQKEVDLLRRRTTDLEFQVKQYKTQIQELHQHNLRLELRTAQSYPDAVLPLRKFHLEKTIPVREGNCRVCAYSASANTLVISHESSNPMYPGYGIRRIRNVGGDYACNNFIFLHKLPMRDMCFHPVISQMLLTVSLDKTARITDIAENVVLKLFRADKPLWSCCWNLEDSNIFYVGTGSGSIHQYSMQSPDMTTVVEADDDKSAVVALKPLPYIGAWFRGGIICCRLNSLTIYKRISDTEFTGTLLPITGPFTSFSLDYDTNHFLVSCRPSRDYPTVRHLYCELVLTQTEITSRTIHTFPGGMHQTLLSRSCCLRLNDDHVIAVYQENSGSIEVWSTKTGSRVQKLTSSEPILDLSVLHVSEQRHMMAGLSEKHVRFYELTGTE